MKKYLDFKSIKFGFASAETESTREPSLLLEGFYDHTGLTSAARGNERFLFLGYKGSGKSAIGKRLALLAEKDPMFFVSSTGLKDFPFNAFRKVGSSESEHESRFPTTWAWLLLLRLIESFRSDTGSSWATDPQTHRATDALESQGFLPIKDLKSLVVKSSKNSFNLSIPTILKAAREESSHGSEIGFLTLVEHLRSLVNGFRSESKHILVIDGLDDILVQKDVQYESLSALILETTRINEELLANGVPAKIIVLCRTDLFELLPDANKNKTRRDSAVSLDWYHDTRSPEETALVQLADLRIQLSIGDPEARLVDYLPKIIDGEPTLSALLNLTRHTPRDFLQLLISIQEFTKENSKVRIEEVLSGMRAYSIDYFLPEIKDELVGSATPAEIEALLDAISAMRSREFKYNKLREFAESSSNPVLKTMDINSLLGVLYNRSAIGTVNGDFRGYSHYTFKFRNRNSTLGYPDLLMLHKGIWKSLNMA